jgi:phosphatidylglycerophosphate synthase
VARSNHWPRLATLDGPVSRYLNRRLSVPIARGLASTPATPNQLSVLALVIAVTAAVLLAAGAHIEAGVLIQFSSIIDGVDGDLARLKLLATRFGGVFDAVLDRYADAAITAGMAVYAYRYEHWPHPALVGLIAIVGFLLVSYSRARIEREGGLEAASALLGTASRDVRLLVLAIGALAGQCWWALVLMSALSYATVAWRLWSFRRAAT